MGVTVRWHDDDHTILIQECSGRWTWSEMYEAMNDANQMMTSVAHPVELIVIVDNPNHMPTGILSNFRTLGHATPANVSHVTLVGVNRMLEMMSDIVRRQFPRLFSNRRAVGTLDAALALIAQERAAAAQQGEQTR